MENIQFDAGEAPDPLQEIAEARAAAADRLVTPWWYHPVLGVLVSGYLVAHSLGSPGVVFAALVIFFGGLVVLTTAYRRLTGIWVSGFSAGRASRWAIALGVVMVVGLLASWAIARSTLLVWPSWFIAGVVWVTVVVLGRRFDGALRAELRSGS